MNRSLPIVILLTLLMSTLWAQDQKSIDYIRCATVEHEAEVLRVKHPNMQTKADFEQWMQRKLEERKNNPNVERVATYQVPYIVHVVHAGEPVGVGDNLSQAQVDAQMKQVNDDFNRLNADTVNTPADFLPVASGLDIEFVPAVFSPEGDLLDEPGIHRVNGLADYGTSSWSRTAIDGTLKPGTGWDPNLVFNIWSANLAGGLLGYAQFPEAPTLPGIGTGNGIAETDGVVILSGSFGSLDSPGTVTGYNLGRTLTHELGHWAGLRHIWGDAAGDDFCDDTPCAGDPNFTGEPCTYPGANSCGEGLPGDLPDMFQNYMDYSDDACFNLFTQDQADRMIVVFENSPRRDTLNESTLAQLPAADTIIADFDIDVTSGCAPLDVVFADNSFVGDEADPITSWEWNFDVDGLGGVSTATFSGETPPTVTFSNAGTYTISLTIDNGTYSNVETSTVTVESVIALDVFMGFESGIPTTWLNDLWIPSSTVGNNSTSSIYQDNFTNSILAPAFISTPSIDMDTMVTKIELTFDYAHAYYGGGFGENEGLAIQVSTDCGITWNEIYRRLDSDDDPFFTVQSTEEGWTPEDEDWATEELDLTTYMGNSNVRVRFQGVSDFGNDTYLDNIRIEAITVAGNSITAEFTTDETVVCAGEEVNFVDASEVGADIDDDVYEWNFDLNGTGSATPATFTGEMPPAVVFGSAGTYEVQLIVSSAIEGTVDTFSLNIEAEGTFDLPFSEDFESGDFPTANATADEGWSSSIAGFDGSSFSIVADNFNEPDLLANYTLPSLDFSDVALASFSFELAHTFFEDAFFGNSYDTLRISYSLDCGSTWTTFYDKNDGDPVNPLFTVDPVGGEFIPSSNDDWRNEEVDITFLKGNSNVRIRFENVGGFGNQLYIDNVNIDAEIVEEDELFALFSTDATSGCVGSAITFSDASTAGANTAITSWEWVFDVNNAGSVSIDSFTGQTPPPVTFNEPGVYDVTLTISDSLVSDEYTSQIFVDVPFDLTYTQDFSSAEFPPMGWTNVLWEQALQSSDPLTGSLFADNYGVPDLEASITTPSFDLTWYDQVSFEFDVAHARFSNFENEGLVVNYSTDCGTTWTEAFSKFDFDAEPLYTVSELDTDAWFPTSDDWREEIVDLSAFNDFSSVQLEIVSVGAFGNNTFVDDVVVEGILFNPTDLTATTAGTSDIQLTWVDNSGKETAYEVLRLNNSTSEFEVVATLGADATFWTDMGLDALTEYTYKVCAFNEKARACSNEASDTTEITLEVSGLIAELSSESGTSIELTWDDLSTTEDGFLIKRSEDGGATYTTINVLTPNQNFYLDEFLGETTTYVYQVCAYNDLDTVSSNTDDATTEINAPSGVSATTVDNNIALSWDDNSLVEEGYQIKRSLTSGGPYTVVSTVGANVTVYTDFGLAELTEYCYVICAVNGTAVACSDEECTTTDIASGLFNELSEAINLYPNPANNYFVLQLNSIKGDVDVKIFNPIGALVANEVFVGGALERMDIQELAAGSYLVRIETTEGFTTKKLIIE